MKKTAFLGLCLTSENRFKYNKEGQIRRSGWLDRAEVSNLMDPDDEARLMYWFPEGSDSEGHQLLTTSWEIPLRDGGVAQGKLVVFKEKVRDEMGRWW
jgi:hypothetical protein